MQKQENGFQQYWIHYVLLQDIVEFSEREIICLVRSIRYLENLWFRNLDLCFSLLCGQIFFFNLGRFQNAQTIHHDVTV